MKNNNISLKIKRDGRRADTKFEWVVNSYGNEWELWRRFAEEWLIDQDVNIGNKIEALIIFFQFYLIPHYSWAYDVLSFFLGKDNQKPSMDELRKITLDNTNRSDNANTTTLLNRISNFIDWILDKYFFQQDIEGKKIILYSNPLNKLRVKPHRSETIHNPLPYRYIFDLRRILCPKSRGDFSDWVWAQQKTSNSRFGGDWFDVDKNVIDKNDKDCVWRTKEVVRNGKSIKIYQLWSPVTSLVLLIKLYLPLRTYQVRMLDSGEADSLRYVTGEWVKNQNSFAMKNYSKGVFRQFKDNSTGFVSTGLYINTNKTADQNKDEFERGYEIPWQNEDVLFWLEKLRNWQEKYNPITKPVDCRTLLTKHTNHKKSEAFLSNMGHICFLFREAAANNIEDKAKPINYTSADTLWYKLLHQLEKNLFSSNELLSDGTALKLVHDYGNNHTNTKTKTYFPLHSLRVSLITCYIMDARLPLAVVSKLLAGHSRILMTVYYTKITPAIIKEKMIEADSILDDKSKESVRTFLKDAEMRQIECKMAFIDHQSVKSILINQNPLGWEYRHHGLCLAGGNTTARTEELKTIAGCWNGGELIKDSTNVYHRIYAAVPHGLENCVRCRWFITDARYLPALNAHLNFMSYKAHEAANLAVKLENDIEVLEESKYEAETKGKPFTKHNELQELQRRYEKQLVEADEYTKDWIATFGLIRRLIEIEKNRVDVDTANKLVAVGSSNDIKISLTETTSELLHLSLLCEDAEIYPDMLDDVKKTSVIQDRTQSLSRFMMRKGYMPQLLLLDKDQQLIAANAMIRQMALQANPSDKLDGYKQVANYLEFGQFMQDSKLLDVGVTALEQQLDTPIHSISMKSLLSHAANGELEDVS